MRHRAFQGGPTRFAVVAVAALWVGGFALACGPDEAPEPAPEPVEEPAVAPPAPEGEAPPAPGAADAEVAPEAFASEGVIPEGYPSDVPLYPGADPGPAMTMPGLGVFATFESDDPVDAILAHFRGELTKGGWAVQDSSEGGVDATKEGREVQVRARPNDSGRSEIAVNIQQSG